MAAVPVPAHAALVPGGEVLIKYSGWPQFHARILLAQISDDWWYILTPDADCYGECLGAGNRDIEQWRLRPADLSIPFGVPPMTVLEGHLW